MENVISVRIYWSSTLCALCGGKYEEPCIKSSSNIERSYYDLIRNNNNGNYYYNGEVVDITKDFDDKTGKLVIYIRKPQ